MSEKLHLRMTLDVVYDANGVEPKVLAENLHNVVKFAMGDGLITGDTEAEVVSHNAEVVQVL